MFSAVEKKLGPVDILVNNAGITKDNLLMRMKKIDAVISVSINPGATAFTLIPREAS